MWFRTQWQKLSTDVIGEMGSVFANQGVPQRVISDNGGNFNADIFKRFAVQWCFDHVPPSQNYSQSNCHIERHVQTVIRMLNKVRHVSDVQMTLLVLRATPIYRHLLTISTGITVWKKGGIESVSCDLERQWQEKRNSCPHRAATGHCQIMPWRSWCQSFGRTWLSRGQLTCLYTVPGHWSMGIRPYVLSNNANNHVRIRWNLPV